MKLVYYLRIRFESSGSGIPTLPFPTSRNTTRCSAPFPATESSNVSHLPLLNTSPFLYPVLPRSARTSPHAPQEGPRALRRSSSMKAGDAAQVAQTAQAAQAAGGGAASTKVLTDTGAAVVTFATEEHAVAVAPTWVEPSPAERKYAEESAANLFNICHKGIAPEIAKFRELLSTGVDIRHKVRPSCVCGEGVVHMCVFVRVHPS